jgi:hypothetical protein
MGVPITEPSVRLAVIVTWFGWLSRLITARKEVKLPVWAEEGTNNFVPASRRTCWADRLPTPTNSNSEAAKKYLVLFIVVLLFKVPRA